MVVRTPNRIYHKNSNGNIIFWWLLFAFRCRSLQGKSTIKSDVWSFAITLWEILTFAREQPFENLSDEKVIENFGHIYQDDKKHVSIDGFHSCVFFSRFLIVGSVRECFVRRRTEVAGGNRVLPNYSIDINNTFGLARHFFVIDNNFSGRLSYYLQRG